MKNKIRSILILRFSSIGDIIQTTSVVGTLKSYFPDTRIDFMTLSKFAPLLTNHKNINKIYDVNIDDGFFVGYGLDHMQLLRGMENIKKIKVE